MTLLSYHQGFQICLQTLVQVQGMTEFSITTYTVRLAISSLNTNPKLMKAQDIRHLKAGNPQHHAYARQLVILEPKVPTLTNRIPSPTNRVG